MACGASGSSRSRWPKRSLRARTTSRPRSMTRRRCLKRVRALLRLIQPALEEDLYRREAERLAGIGKLLSGARDLDVMRQTLSKLESRFDSMPSGARSGSVRSSGTATVSTAAPAPMDDGKRCSAWRNRESFSPARRSLTYNSSQLIEGLGRTYRKARKSLSRGVSGA